MFIAKKTVVVVDGGVHRCREGRARASGAVMAAVVRAFGWIPGRIRCTQLTEALSRAGRELFTQ